MLARIKQGVSLRPVTAAKKEEKPALDFHAALQAKFAKMSAIDESDSDDQGDW